MQEILTVQGLNKTFRLPARQQRLNGGAKTIHAVKDLSFSANKGEIFGLLGPNGAGKTTTLRMLATLIRPDSGDALVDGASIRTQPEKVRNRIAFLTSDLKLEGFFTPDYLFDFFAQLHGVEPEVREARKRQLFDRFGISDFAQVRVSSLSTGMAQKAALVISLVHDPDIIIFDEPTNGLDVLTAKTVTDFLLELRARGKTLLISSHIFSLIERLCDRVGIVIDGHMCLCDKLETILAGKSLEDRFFDIYAERKGARQ